MITVPSRMNTCWIIILLFLAVIISSINGQGQGYPGEILNGPETQIVIPGEIAHFNCHARGDNVYWYINNSDPHPQSTYEASGFSFSYIEIPHSSSEPEEHNNTITVEARPSNNNTRISCTAVGTYSNQQAFQEGILIIAGPPSPPVLEFTQDHLVDDYIHSQLLWSTPFTLPDFPITNYTITIFNHSDGDTITTKRRASFDGYSHHTLSQGHHCYELDFTVMAANRLGRSPPASIYAGHPIVPSEIDEIESIVTFTTGMNATPYLLINFTVPRICPYYQTGYYNITIYDIMNDSIILHVGPMEYSQINKSKQTLEFGTELDSDKYYTVEVIAESIGVVQVKRKNINTFTPGSNHNITTEQDQMTGSGSPMTTASTKDTDIDLSSTMDCGPQLSLAVAIPLMITSFFIGVIIMLVVISVTCIFARKWKRCSHQRGCDADKHDTCELEIKI